MLAETNLLPLDIDGRPEAVWDIAKRLCRNATQKKMPNGDVVWANHHGHSLLAALHDIKSVKENNKALTAKVDFLWADNKTLKVDNKTLKADNETLSARIDFLWADNKTLKADNETLNARIDFLWADNKTLKAENNTFKADIKTLKKEVEAQQVSWCI